MTGSCVKRRKGPFLVGCLVEMMLRLGHAMIRSLNLADKLPTACQSQHSQDRCNTPLIVSNTLNSHGHWVHLEACLSRTTRSATFAHVRECLCVLFAILLSYPFGHRLQTLERCHARPGPISAPAREMRLNRDQSIIIWSSGATTSLRAVCRTRHLSHLA